MSHPVTSMHMPLPVSLTLPQFLVEFIFRIDTKQGYFQKGSVLNIFHGLCILHVVEIYMQSMLPVAEASQQNAPSCRKETKRLQPPS